MEKIKELETIIKEHLPHTTTTELIHDRAHQELLRQLMSKLDDQLHNLSPATLRELMEKCIEMSNVPRNDEGATSKS